MDTGWEVYSKMVLKQLEDLSNSMNGLRQEIQELKMFEAAQTSKNHKSKNYKLYLEFLYRDPLNWKI